MTRPLLAAVLLTAACTAPTVTTGAVTENRGEAVITAVPVVTPSPVAVAPRPVATRASRSERRETPPPTGTLTDTTAYCDHGLMADGQTTRAGVAASNRYDFGTRLLVEGFGVVTIHDRIGHGSSLDLWLSSCADALTFGRKQLRVAVVR